MPITNVLKWFGKACLAGIAAFLFMTVFCLGYYNLPAHVSNPDGSTDYKWEPNSVYSKFTEGIACGRINNDGFVNAIDYAEGMKIDILVMGSSHMEATNVFMNESVTARLNETLNGKTAYNIGISAHNFPNCCLNYEAALNHYKPSDYAVIETSKINFSERALKSVINKTLPEIADHSGGLLGFLSKNPFLRCLYGQLKNRNATDGQDQETAPAVSKKSADQDTGESLDKVLAKLSEISSAHDVSLIIFYHPTTAVDSDGSLLLPANDEEKMQFAELCEKNGIIFLDMTERFEYEYYTNHILPHGFCNTSIGSGHLNKYGHDMIAGELRKIMY